MSAPLYNVGDRVRASHVASKILEPAVIEEIVKKWLRYLVPTIEGIERQVPLYWIRFDVGGMLVPRWQNELVAVLEPILKFPIGRPT